ncbi:MAG TPA: hypothetical protein VEZ13_05425 [Brevibacillus sp.]|nr:hypothetical protein [Brevibacillus sp.]
MKRPTYTLPSIVKKVFRSGERSLPRMEICARMEENELMAYTDLDSGSLLDTVLKMEQTPVRVGSSEAIVELTYQPHQLYDLAYRFLRESQTPKLVEQIVAELRRHTQFGWNQTLRLLQLERDPRFVQFQGDSRWFLAEWTLANDQVFAFCEKNGITQVTSRSLVHFLEQEVRVAADAAFLPGLDDRFRIDGDTLYIMVTGNEAESDLAVQEVAAAAVPDMVSAEEINQHEKNHQVLKEMKEDHTMNNVQSQSVFQEVQQLLEEAINRLELRHTEMSQEVVAHFQQSNMQAIEVLMKEKHKNEQIALGIRQVLAASEQQ